MARRAVRKALERQRDGAGFSIVEILSPCPTIWNKDPIEARRSIADKMIPAFPLNVFRGHQTAPLAVKKTDPPQRSVADVLGIKQARMHYVRGMVALGIKSGREREHVGGTKLHTSAACFTALYDDGNASFCHGDSTLKGGRQ